MNAGFDSVYNLYNDTILDVSEIIDTLVYTEGIEENRSSRRLWDFSKTSFFYSSHRRQPL
ncbi:MAG: hypothetical protein ACLRSW_06635 [Christensenellaceae bacterium]